MSCLFYLSTLIFHAIVDCLGFRSSRLAIFCLHSRKTTRRVVCAGRAVYLYVGGCVALAVQMCVSWCVPCMPLMLYIFVLCEQNILFGKCWNAWLVALCRPSLAGYTLRLSQIHAMTGPTSTFYILSGMIVAPVWLFRIARAIDTRLIASHSITLHLSFAAGGIVWFTWWWCGASGADGKQRRIPSIGSSNT